MLHYDFKRNGNQLSSVESHNLSWAKALLQRENGKFKQNTHGKRIK